MLVLALDTTTRRGSAALVREHDTVDCEIGDAQLTHGQRLPGDLIRLLDRNHVRVSDIDLFAVAAGPGSFTGLRIGIATMQGLAMANGRGLLGISALDALNMAAQKNGRAPFSRSEVAQKAGGPVAVGVLMDAHRGELFCALYRGDDVVDGPSVEAPQSVLARWKGCADEPLTLVGDGVLAYRDLIASALPRASVTPDIPSLAPFIGALALQHASAAVPAAPDAIRPIYVRRPDAELARDRVKS